MNPSPELIFWAGFAVGTALSAFAVVVSGVAKVFAFLDRMGELETEPTVRDFITWLESRGVSWQATLNDARHYLAKVAPEPTEEQE